MKKILKNKEILVYYDEPVLSVFEDQENLLYLCLLVENSKYLCAPISPSKLDDFKEDKIDLIDLYKTNEFYLASVTDEEMIGEPIDPSNIPKEWLPEKNFFLNK
jgi:hypothetical protein